MGQTVRRTATDGGDSVAVETNGRVYVTGHFSGIDDWGAGLLTSNGQDDIFLASFTSDGVPRWSRHFGSPLTDIGTGVATDTDGNVHLTGIFEEATDLGGETLSPVRLTTVFSLPCLTPRVCPRGRGASGLPCRAGGMACRWMRAATSRSLAHS